MTEQEWLESQDVRTMVCALDALHGPDDENLDRNLRQYYLESCRRLWPVIPREESRRGVEIAERHLRGEASEQELNDAEYAAESAAFLFDYNTEPETVDRLANAVESMAPDEMRAIVGKSLSELGWSGRYLLMRTAYLVDYAMLAHRLRPKRLVSPESALLLSAALLRGHFENPFRARGLTEIDTSRAAERDDGTRFG